MLKTYTVKVKKNTNNAIAVPLSTFLRVDLIYSDAANPLGTQLSSAIPLICVFTDINNNPVADNYVITSGYVKTTKPFKQVNFVIPDFVTETEFFARVTIGDSESGDNLSGGAISATITNANLNVNYHDNVSFADSLVLMPFYTNLGYFTCYLPCDAKNAFGVSVPKSICDNYTKINLVNDSLLCSFYTMPSDILPLKAGIYTLSKIFEKTHVSHPTYDLGVFTYMADAGVAGVIGSLLK